MKIRRKNLGFTLIELLAVIVILAVLLGIAIPMVSGYMTNSRKDSYIDSIKLYIDDVKAKQAIREYTFTNPDVTYYIHFDNIDTDREKKSPFADWEDGYVIVVYDKESKTYEYYVTSVDKKGYKVAITEETQLTRESVFRDDDLTLSVGRVIGDRDQVIVYGSSGEKDEVTPVYEYTKEEAEVCYNFKVENNSITILKYNKECGLDVVIPTKIDGYPVKSISAHAFTHMSLTSVKFPNTIVTIGTEAFYNSKLTSVSFPETLRTIGNRAFAKNQLTELPDISMVTSLGSGVFSGNLFSEDEAYIYKKNSDGTYDYSTIMGYAGTSKNLVIPSTKNGVQLKVIGYMAFRSLSLDSVVIPEGVDTIDTQAFNACNLKSVSLPSTLKTIKEGAFSSNQLTSISIPSSVTFIGRAAFNTNKLPASQAYIYKRTASGIDYSSIVSYGGANKNITIPSTANGVTLRTIESLAFKDVGLTGVVIPSTVTSIQYGAFNNNKLPTSQAFIYARNTSGIDYSKIVSYGGASKQVVIPASQNGVALRTIGEASFQQTYITSVEIPEGVTTIMWNAFYWCYLKSVTIPSTVTSIGSAAFKKETTWSIFNPYSKITNRTGRSFNWTSITGGIGTNTFVTGTVTHPFGNVVVRE